LKKKFITTSKNLGLERTNKYLLNNSLSMEITKFIHTKKSFLLNLKIKKNKKNSKLK
jgi:hypothetical protein